MSRRRFLPFLLVLLTAGTFLAGTAGCGRGADRVGLGEVAKLASETLVGTLLGSAPSEQITAMARPEPPLLSKGGFENVLLATDEAGFVAESKGALGAKDIKAVAADILHSAAGTLKKRGFTVTAVPFPPKLDPAIPNMLLATFTPATEEGGSPDDKRAGKATTFVLMRLTITDPRTNTVLRVREFYSGRDANGRGGANRGMGVR